MNDKIDIVIPWVDGSDPEWLREKNFWSKKLDSDIRLNSNNRYQSWDNLHFLFRALETCMPWLNKIFFITWGHLPSFININNSKLVVIEHKDYIPKHYLPTFNANTIELNLHRIEALSENFIYFNDDIFPLSYIKEEYYFQYNKVCDEAIETPIIPMLNGDIDKYTWNMRALDTAIINRHFNKRLIQRKNYDKWFNDKYGDLLERNETLAYWDNFVGFRDPHMPVAFKKSTFEKVWQVEKALLDRACVAKFRTYESVNQWLIRYWQLCEGEFVPRRTLGKSYVVTHNNCDEIANIIAHAKQQMICINEDCSEGEFCTIKERINSALKEVFPVKSSFEL